MEEFRTWLMGIDHELLETKFNEEMTKNGPHLKQIIVDESEDNKIETPSKDRVDIQNNTRHYWCRFQNFFSVSVSKHKCEFTVSNRYRYKQKKVFDRFAAP